MIGLVRGGLAAVLLSGGLAACASAPPPPVSAPPRYPDFPAPEIPATVQVPDSVREAHALAWRRLQAGDLRGASRGFSDILKRAPAFYPAEVGQGFVELAQEQFKQAAARFRAALARDDGYLPAWRGDVEAEVALGDDAAALAALDRVLVLDPTLDEARSRRDLLRFRQVQSLIETSRKARAAGRLDEAKRSLEQALTLSPTSGLILRDLAGVELLRNELAAAEAHARRAVDLDVGDAEAQAELAAILEAEGHDRDAAGAYRRAFSLDPRPEWAARGEALRTKSDLAELPAEFRGIPTAPAVTRAQVAAFIGTRLSGLLAAAPRRVTEVATDVRGHWAAKWILLVTQAGVMEILPNHTFQPGAPVRRGELAQIVTSVAGLLGPAHAADLARFRAARPTFSDLSVANVYFRPAAFAVSAGLMTPDDTGRFDVTRPASGADLAAAVGRIERLAGG
jgi:tetratricopeptide (TPR) repeat protein